MTVELSGKTNEETVKLNDLLSVEYDLSCWFGLSYASWLTLSRVMMEAMPKEWQHKMAKLLNEFDDMFPEQPDIGTRVQATKNGKLVKTPGWLLNYRHPDFKQLQRMMGPVDR